MQEFSFSVDDLDGIRMIRIEFPPSILPYVLAEAYAQYMSLWEVESPTVVLADISRLEAFPPEAQAAIGVLLRRVGIMSSFVASSWICGGNELVAEQIANLLRAGGRDSRAVASDEEAALAYLRERVVDWRARQVT